MEILLSKDLISNGEDTQNIPFLPVSSALNAN